MLWSEEELMEGYPVVVVFDSGDGKWLRILSSSVEVPVVGDVISCVCACVAGCGALVYVRLARFGFEVTVLRG